MRGDLRVGLPWPFLAHQPLPWLSAEMTPGRIPVAVIVFQEYSSLLEQSKQAGTVLRRNQAGSVSEGPLLPVCKPAFTQPQGSFTSELPDHPSFLEIG